MKFYDTNVLYGLATGEPRYGAYDGKPFRTSDANLFELRSLILRRGLQVEVTPFLGASESVTRADFLVAAEFQNRHRLSAIDGIGYAVARRLGIPFVTADRKHFRGLAGVELV